MSSDQEQPVGGTAVLDPDVSVVVDVDIEKDVACCQANCSTPATWLAIVRHTTDGTSCGPWPYCAPHRVRAVLVMRTHEAMGAITGCISHELPVDITWRSL